MTVPNATGKGEINSTLSNQTSSDGVTVLEERFNWDSYQTNFVLGSFFWGYVLTELPGGRLAELIGGRRVFGHSMLWASVLTLITPLAAHLSYVMLIVVRVALGFMLGASWPAIHPVAAVWIPPMERSKFMSNMMGKSLYNSVCKLQGINHLSFVLFSLFAGRCNHHARVWLPHLCGRLGQRLLLDGRYWHALVALLVLLCV